MQENVFESCLEFPTKNSMEKPSTSKVIVINVYIYIKSDSTEASKQSRINAKQKNQDSQAFYERNEGLLQGLFYGPGIAD